MNNTYKVSSYPAYMDSVPMVAITANVALPSLGKDSFQEVDIAGVTMPITKQLAKCNKKNPH